jgi:hypothetical protein
VFLDEPSKGLDPASRATLWDVIKRAKKERAIVLTTHAMEEAEELCDRLGIFVDGSMRCVGAPKELTARYGGFLVLTLTTTALQLAETEAFVRQLSPNAQRTYALGSTLKYDLPLSEVNLASVFAAVSERKDALGIIDWGVSNMTLEEVRASAAQRATGLPLTRFHPAGFHQARARDWCHHQGVIQSIAFKEYNAYSNTRVRRPSSSKHLLHPVQLPQRFRLPMELCRRVEGCDKGDLLCVEASRRTPAVAVGSEARALLRSPACATCAAPAPALTRPARRRARCASSTRAVSTSQPGCATQAAQATPSLPSPSTQARRTPRQPATAPCTHLHVTDSLGCAPCSERARAVCSVRRSCARARPASGARPRPRAPHPRACDA